MNVVCVRPTGMSSLIPWFANFAAYDPWMSRTWLRGCLGWVWVGKVVGAEGWRRPVSSTLRPWQPDSSNMNRIKCEHSVQVWECYFPISWLSRPSIGSLDPNSLPLRNTIHVPSVCQWTRPRENAHSMYYSMFRKYEFQFVSDLNHLCFYPVLIFLFKIQWFELIFFCFGCLTQMPWEGQ